MFWMIAGRLCAALIVAVVAGAAVPPCLAAGNTPADAPASKADGVAAPIDRMSIADLLRELKGRGAMSSVSTQRLRARGSSASESAGRAASDALKAYSTGQVFQELLRKERAIFGEDTRREVISLPAGSKARRYAESVAMLTEASQLKVGEDGRLTLKYRSLGEVYNLCPSERFFQQPCGGFCSGFLVAPDIIATAAHCLNSSNYKDVRFVFGFRLLDENRVRTEFSPWDVYSASEIVAWQLEEDGPDWCLVRLDRPAHNRASLPVRQKGAIKAGTPVYVIGHPCGLPAKYAGEAKATDVRAQAYFASTVDVLGGNSGCPVFNAKTNQVEGILVRGSPSTALMDAERCRRFVPWSEDDIYGNEVVRASEFLPALSAKP